MDASQIGKGSEAKNNLTRQYEIRNLQTSLVKSNITPSWKTGRLIFEFTAFCCTGIHRVRRSGTHCSGNSASRYCHAPKTSTKRFCFSEQSPPTLGSPRKVADLFFDQTQSGSQQSAKRINFSKNMLSKLPRARLASKWQLDFMGFEDLRVSL